ncbi:hypothetical protein MKW98_003979 [Papaver atlanticum]|uniref:Thionin n=1 Tax=Papaver atlanticum TaxID=357466 RepID=A0AAD4SLS6_9MAGN|nr:hypothetical protein MKW98_003979 [Papaver atlanticum]
MEGKSPALSAVMIGVLLIGLFLAHTFVEADTPCCTTYNQQKCFHRCREEGGSKDYCSNWCGCHSCVLSQTPVEAPKICCMNDTRRNRYEVCLNTGASVASCAGVSGCLIIYGSFCPPNYPHKVGDEEKKEQTLQTANDFCKLGCASSVCSNIIALYESADSTNKLKEAVERCNNACFQFCNKKSDTAAVAAN